MKNLNPAFKLLCWSNLFFSASFSMLIPELGNHLIHLEGKNGAEYVGYIIALFTLSAGFARPFSGKITDEVGRLPIIILGSVVCTICGVLYIYANTVALFLLLRLFHGFSTGTTPTGVTAYAADIVSEKNRGQAMGTLGIFSAVGMGIAPFVGSEMTRKYGIDSLFLASGLLSLCSILILSRLPETLSLEKQKKFSWSLLKLKKSEIWYPKATFPAIICFLLTFASGVVLTLVPLMTEKLGFQNKGWFFAVYTFIALLMRLLFAQVSDKKGRIPVLFISTCFLVCSLSVLTILAWKLNDSNTINQLNNSNNWFEIGLFFTSSILFGMGWGLNSPTLQAWTVDLSEPQHRGKGIATMFIGFEAGIGIGSIVAGYLYGYFNKAHFTTNFGFMTSFIVAIFCAVLACALMKVHEKSA